MKTSKSSRARRSTATLATVETGGSYAIDAGLYTVQAADGAAPYAAFAPVAATYYIPRAEAAGGTRWFVVQVSNASSANPNKVTSAEYLLFTQTASGGPWQNAVEPYLLATANAPQVAIGGNGLATAVSATAPLPVADFIAHTYPSLSRRVADYVAQLDSLDQPRLHLELAPSNTRSAIVTATLFARAMRFAFPKIASRSTC